MIEEAPAPGLDRAARAYICQAAMTAARTVAYEGAGTVEFIADASRGLRRRSHLVNGDEHTASGRTRRSPRSSPVRTWWSGSCAWRQASRCHCARRRLAISGWAIEARLYAEDPASGFPALDRSVDALPASPGGVRVDSAVEEGGEVTRFYDPMIAKIVAAGPTRATAASRLARACCKWRCGPLRPTRGSCADSLRCRFCRGGR